MDMKVFVQGKILELDTKEAVEKFRQAYVPVIQPDLWREDILNWTLAVLMREGFVKLSDEKGRDITSEALEAVKNTMQLIGIWWKDVYKLVGRE